MLSGLPRQRIWNQITSQPNVFPPGCESHSIFSGTFQKDHRTEPGMTGCLGILALVTGDGSIQQLGEVNKQFGNQRYS